MFGYLRVYKPELKIKEYEAYKSVYCSLCKSIKKEYGIFMTGGLNYEATFLALFSLALSDGCVEFKRCACSVNLFKKCNIYIGKDEHFRFAAAVTVVLLYCKLVDGIADEKTVKRLSLKILKPYLKRKFKKAVFCFPELNKIFTDYTENQRLVELSRTADVDLAAEPSAKFLKDIFSVMSKSPDISMLGYYIGRWIYLIDAYDDIESDKKSRNYNVFLTKQDTSTSNDINSYAFGVLNLTLGQIVEIFESIEMNCFKPVLENIIRNGMSVAQDSVKEKVRRIYESV